MNDFSTQKLTTFDETDLNRAEFQEWDPLRDLQSQIVEAVGPGGSVDAPIVSDGEVISMLRGYAERGKVPGSRLELLECFNAVRLTPSLKAQAVDGYLSLAERMLEDGNPSVEPLFEVGSLLKESDVEPGQILEKGEPAVIGELDLAQVLERLESIVKTCRAEVFKTENFGDEQRVAARNGRRIGEEGADPDLYPDTAECYFQLGKMAALLHAKLAS